MGSMPFALSVHNFISSVGADAGFASIIGLAIVILLYFAHARETTALREQAADLAARLHDAEARLVQATRTGAAEGTVAGAPAGVQAQGGTIAPATPTGAVRVLSSPAPALASVPSAPAGVGAPALATATRFVALAPVAPAPQAAPIPPRVTPAPPVVQPIAQPATVAVPPPAVPIASAPSGVISAPPPAAPVEEPAEAIPAPQTEAGAANGGGEGAGGAQGASRAVPRPLPSRLASRPAQAAAARPYPPLTSPPRRRSSSRGLASAVIVVLVVVAAVAALLVATSGGGTPSRRGTSQASNAPSGHGTGGGFTPASVTVAVLNGTATNNLAHTVAARLAADGYKEGRVATAADQTKVSTTVAYLPGYRSAAVHVARSLKLGLGSLAPIDPAAQQVACPGAGACPANVVVTVGTDLATP